MSTIDRIKTQVGESRSFEKLSQYIKKSPERIWAFQLFPALFWVVFFLGTSLLIVFMYSFTQNAFDGNFALTVEHYRGFFGSDTYVRIFIDSLIIALISTTVNLFVTYPVAYYLAFFIESRRWRNITLLLLILPFWINIVIRAYAWRNVLSERGPLNYILYDQLGVISTHISLLQTKTAVIIGLLHVFIPYMLISVYATLDGLDRDQIEAAQNLGANKFEAFYQVTLPQSMPGIIAGSTIVFVLSTGAYVTPILLGGYKNSMISNVIGSMFRGLQNWGLGTAISIVFVTTILLFIFIINHVASLDELYSSEEGAS